VNCTQCQDRLLEADAATLRGEGDPAVAEHIRVCASCAAIARMLLDEEVLLREALAGLTPVAPIEPAATAAVRESLRRARRRRWAALIPLAAAASLVAVLLTGTGDLPPGSARPLATPPPLVEASDQNVVVYQTENPDVVVIWLYSNNGSGT
jgi:anti-sigma factor RsiW